MKKHNFSAGPCILPDSVMQQAAQGILNYNGIDLSIIEISHRSAEFVAVMEEAQSLALELLDLEDKGYAALFLQGGASMQFLATTLNLLETKAGYINTGTWSTKAIKEAQHYGQIIELASSKDKNFNYIPKDIVIPEGLDYVHLTTNNTIFGTQFNDFPQTDTSLVCDMSSDIFSRVIDYSRFDLIYAGAQKNMGPAGTTLVVVKKDILGKVSRHIPSMLDYQLQISKDSMFNTPPVFAVYVSMLTLKWLKELGGVAAIEKKNNQKAAVMYNEIDCNPLFTGFVGSKEDRSKMNATFTMSNPDLKDRFDALWKEAGVSGVSGHRSVGGYRASMYNALPLESVQVLVDVMKHLETKA